MMFELDTPVLVVELPANLDLNNVSTLTAMLAEKMEQSVKLLLDCSGVTRITTPAVQVLLAYDKTTQAEGRKTAIRNPSSAFRSAFCDLGLGGQLSNWSSV